MYREPRKLMTRDFRGTIFNGFVCTFGQYIKDLHSQEADAEAALPSCSQKLLQNLFSWSDPAVCPSVAPPEQDGHTGHLQYLLPSACASLCSLCCWWFLLMLLWHEHANPAWETLSPFCSYLVQSACCCLCWVQLPGYSPGGRLQESECSGI